MHPLPLFIDTHAHLDWFLEKGNLQKVLDDSITRKVNVWIVPGVKPTNWKRIHGVCTKVKNAFPAYGAHPLHADDWGNKAADELLLLSESSCGIGEIGLDYYPLSPGKNIQMGAFVEQMEIAVHAQKPVIIHCRKAFNDTVNVLSRYRSKVRGVMHAFSGSYETASRCLDQGFIIGVAGSVTYPDARKLPELLPRLPLDSILIETDSPDIAPHPHRNETNTPSNLPVIAARVAELMKVSIDKVMTATAFNAITLFGLETYHA